MEEQRDAGAFGGKWAVEKDSDFLSGAGSRYSHLEMETRRRAVNIGTDAEAKNRVRLLIFHSVHARKKVTHGKGSQKESGSNPYYLAARSPAESGSTSASRRRPRAVRVCSKS